MNTADNLKKMNKILNMEKAEKAEQNKEYKKEIEVYKKEINKNIKEHLKYLNDIKNKSPKMILKTMKN